MILKYTKLEQEGIVIEEDKMFQDSAFCLVFQKARRLIEDVIRKNRIPTELFPKTVQEQANNVISFIGRRGTGKTSVMLSVHQMFKNYQKNNFLRECKGYEDASFITIDYIDASKLEKGEDILELVLANMFSKLRKYDEDLGTSGGLGGSVGGYMNRKLYQLFDEIYGSLPTVLQHAKDYHGISPIRMLTQLSNSQMLGIKMQTLVREYLAYLASASPNSNNNHFLVIAIDDIDMHFQSEGKTPYDMLETIHRYLMIPGVIVLLTYNYVDLRVGVEKHFRKVYKVNDAIMMPDEDIKAISINYLQKILPMHTRIGMHSLNKKDYSLFSDNMVKIQFERDKVNEVLQPFVAYLVDGDQKTLELSIKRFVFLLKASVAGLYYDANGEKFHFAEPSTLRELAQICKFYGKYQGALDETKLEELFKELLDDLYFRYAKEELTWIEMKQFNEYLSVSVERRSRDIIRDVQEKFGKGGYSQITFRGSMAFLFYGYGELSYALYIAKHKKMLSKGLVCCILHSYTILLTEFYHRMLLEEQSGNQQENRRRIIQIMGASVAGSWSNLITPRVHIIQNQELKPNKEYTIGREQSNIVSVGAIQFGKTRVEWTFKLSKQRNLVEQIRMFEMLNMFWTEVETLESASDQGQRTDITFRSGSLEYAADVPGSDQPPVFVIQCSTACFNIFNFVNNLFAAADFFRNLHSQMLPVLTEFCQQLVRAGMGRQCGIPYEDTEKVTVEWVRDLLEDSSLKKMGKDWFVKWHGLAMPIYSFDMMYNIFKRQYQNYMPDLPMAKLDEFWGYLQQVYEEIGDLLRQEDEFYYSNGAGEMDQHSYHFYRAYKDSPFLAYLQTIQKNDALSKEFQERFTDMISSIAQIR